MKKLRRTTLIVVVVLIVGAIAAWQIKKYFSKPFDVTYVTVTVGKGTISTSITATGSIEPVTEVEVGTQVSGQIASIYVDYNDVVTKGQLLAELDTKTLKSTLNTANSNLSTAKASLNYQKKNYERYKTLYEKGLVSTDDFDSAELSYLQAVEEVARAEENVIDAETNLGYAIITSPIDGVILTKEVEEGQTVAASYETPTLFTIAQNLTEMQVVADIDEADIGGVKEGQRVTFTVDAYPGETFDGTVTQVRLEGVEDNNVITYEVVISAPNDDLKLLPGLTANVSIYTMEVDDVLCVPTKALRFEPTKETIGKQDKIEDVDASKKLWTRDGRTFKAIAVEVGITNGIYTEILSGVQEGDVVITEMISREEAEEEEPTATNPFMPRPRNNNNNKKKEASSSTEEENTSSSSTQQEESTGGGSSSSSSSSSAE